MKRKLEKGTEKIKREPPVVEFGGKVTLTSEKQNHDGQLVKHRAKNDPGKQASKSGYIRPRVDPALQSTRCIHTDNMKLLVSGRSWYMMREVSSFFHKQLYLLMFGNMRN